MGSIYMATCVYKEIIPVPKISPIKEKPSTKIPPSVEGVLLEKETSLVKFGNSFSNNPTKRIDGLKEKFSGMKHQCHTCYVSKYYKCIEEYLHVQFENQRVTNLWSRLNNGNMNSSRSQEHYRISIGEALDAFKKAIEKIEGPATKCTPCSSGDNFCPRRFIRE